MLSERTLASCLVAFHLLAIGVAAIPSPADLTASGRVRQPPAGALTRMLMPQADALEEGVASLQTFLYRTTRPFAWLTAPYVGAGLTQRWNMFANPATTDQYVRMDYVVGPVSLSSGDLVLSELVYPAAPEERVRWHHEFRDKAIFSALSNYVSSARRSDAVQVTGDPEELVPVVRHFARTRASAVPAGSALKRVRVWYGFAPIPGPGVRISDSMRAERIALLTNYRQPLGAQSARRLNVARVGDITTEADIRWMLVYSGEPR